MDDKQEPSGRLAAVHVDQAADRAVLEVKVGMRRSDGSLDYFPLPFPGEMPDLDNVQQDRTVSRRIRLPPSALAPHAAQSQGVVMPLQSLQSFSEKFAVEGSRYLEQKRLIIVMGFLKVLLEEPMLNRSHREISLDHFPAGCSGPCGAGQPREFRHSGVFEQQGR